jgi:Flp pilus assembly pilin Flp
MVSIIQAGVRYLQYRFPREERENGAVTTEYGLLVVFIALAVIAGLFLLGQALLEMFNDAESCVSSGDAGCA